MDSIFESYHTKYDPIVTKIFGEEWKTLQQPDSDGVLGVLIVKSILDGIKPDVRRLADYLGLTKDDLLPAYTRLSANGVFLRHRLQDDRKMLEMSNDLAWCYYAGYASGDTGKCAN